MNLTGTALTEPVRSPQTVAGNPLPRLYVYDHCPFCVRARIIMGIKNVKHDVIFLANDDVDTPTRLVYQFQNSRIVQTIYQYFTSPGWKESSPDSGNAFLRRSDEGVDG